MEISGSTLNELYMMQDFISLMKCNEELLEIEEEKWQISPMSTEELLEYQLKKEDFQIGIDGVTIKLNSHIIKKILHDQALANELRRTHDFYLKSKNGYCAGVTMQILDLSNYNGRPVPK